MNQQRIILVTGATGAQGSSVARALLSNKKFSIRILTRNKYSANAIALQQAGAGVIEGSYDDMAVLKQAMQGVYGVFGVTSYYEHAEKEYQHGKNIIDAVKASDIKHFVLSTSAGYYSLSNGQYAVPQHDIKAALQEYAKNQQLPVTFVQLSFYYENFFSQYPLQRDEEGRYFFGLPQGDTPLAAVSVEDAGAVVATIFDHPRAYTGRTVRIVGENITCQEYAAIMADVLEQPVYYKYIPREEFAVTYAKEVANMFEVQRLFISGRQLDLIESYGLNPRMQPFKNWVTKNKEKIIQQYAMQQQEAVA